MFKYVYEISPVDFMDGTLPVENYIDMLLEELNSCKDCLLETDDFTTDNNCTNLFDTKNSGADHPIYRLQKVSKSVEEICGYLDQKGIKIIKKNIRIFSVPNDGMCEVSYMVKTKNNGITYVFSDMYFPFLNKKDNQIKKL